jgi:type II secretion system protein N
MTFDWFRKPRWQKAARIVGYVLFGLVVFTVAAVATFPTPKLRSYLENRLSTGGRIVRIADMSLRGLASARLYGVGVELPPERHQTPDGRVETQPRKLMLDRVDVSLGLFRLLVGTLAVEATIHDGDGVLGPVRVVRGGGTVSVTVEAIRDFPLPDELPLFGVRFDGRIASGKAALALDEAGGLAASTGDLELVGEQIRAIQPMLRSKAQGNVQLTDANLGTLALEVHLGKRSEMPAFKGDRRSAMGDATVIHVAKADLDGTDIKALVEGQSTIRLFPGKGFGEGQLSLEAAFSFSDPFLDRKVKSGGETRTPNAFLRTLLSMDPRWRNAQSGNYWGIVCSGPVSRPACNPKKPAIRGGDFKAPPKPEPEVEDAAAAGGGSAPAPAPAPRATTTRGTTAPAPAPVSPPSYAPSTPGPAPVVPAPQLTPPPRREMPGAVEAPQPVELPSQIQVPAIDQVNAPIEVRTPPLRPTVIGRARLRSFEPAEEPAPSEGGEAEAPPAPATEPATEEEE